MCSIVVNRVPNKVNTVYGANVIIFEGIFGLYDKKVLEMMVNVLDPFSPSPSSPLQPEYIQERCTPPIFGFDC